MINRVGGLVCISSFSHLYSLVYEKCFITYYCSVNL